MNFHQKKYIIQFLSKTSEFLPSSKKWQVHLMVVGLRNNPLYIKFWLEYFQRSILRSHCAFCTVTVHWTCVIVDFFLKKKLGQKLCHSFQRPTPIGRFFAFFVVLGVRSLHYCDIWILMLLYARTPEYKFIFHSDLQVCERLQRWFLPFWPKNG